METLIKLTKLLDSLTMDEFIQLIKLCDKSFMVNIIFQNFHSQLKLAANTHQIHNLTTSNPNITKLFECSSKIIKSRDEYKNTIPQNNNFTNENSESELEQESEPLKIDELPLEMISFISSFMDFQSILSFEKTNKSIFIGTRSPPSLQEINAEMFGKCISYCRNNKSIYHYYRFKNLKRIEMEIGDLYAYHYPDDLSFSVPPILTDKYISMQDFPFWNSLQCLSIFDEQYAYDEEVINQLSCCDLSNIHTFRFQGEDYSGRYLKLISNAQFVDFNGSADLDEMSRIQSTHNFRGFSVSCYISEQEKELRKVLFKPVKETLESLHVPPYPGYVEFIDAKLGNLKELCLSEWSQTDIDCLMKHNMKKLKRIYLCNVCDDGCIIIPKIKPFLIQCNSLEYIHANLLHRSTNSALIMLRNVLNNRQKPRMKLYICVKDSLCFDITHELLTLINVLNESFQHFMLICDLWVEFEISDKMKEFVSKLQQTFHVASISEGRPLKFVVTNKKCNINGYKESWIMNCDRCS
eukprot:52922_1